MKLLDRYLQSIKTYLPEAQRDDILQELTQNLLARIEDQEATLGRKLTEDELAAVLKQHGHPLVVAGRYLPRQHLIGPAMFPVYWYTLKMTLWIATLIYVVIAATLSFVAGLVKATGKPVPETLLEPSVALSVWGGVALLLGLFGLVTLAFAVLEICLTRFRPLDRWDPRSLYPAANGELKPRTEAIVMSVGCGLYLLCTMVMPNFPLVVGRSAEFLQPTVVWAPYRVALMVFMLLGAVEGFVFLARQEWLRFLPVTKAAHNALGVAILFLLFRAGDLVALAEPSMLTASEGHRVVSIVNQCIHYGLLVGLLMAALTGAVKLAKYLLRRFQGRPSAAHLLVAVLLSLVPFSLQAMQTSSDDIRKILVERVDVQHRSVGIVVGVVSPEGQRVVAYGKLSRDGDSDVDGDTLFEIGSVTKVFTSLLLSDMVRRGEVALNDPLCKFLPAGVKAPEWKGQAITLVDLATHTAGLPFFPTNFPHAEDRPAYGKYTLDQFYQFLSKFELTRGPGTKWEYSNTAGGLLGLALSRHAGMDYEALVRSRITGPLGLENTSITVAEKAKARLAEGHNAELKPQPVWDLPALPGAGSLHSSANDLLALLAAFTGNAKSPLQPAMEAMAETVRPNRLYMIDQGLGWFIIGKGPDRLLIHGGGTFGFASSIAYSPKDRTGVVVLSNAAGGVDDIARHLLRPSMPLDKPQPRKEHHEIAVDPKLLDLYTGQYRPSPDWVYTVSREGDTLRIQLPAAPSMRLFAETDKDFFIKEDNIQVSFRTNEQGAVTGLVLHLWGFDAPAARIATGEAKK